MSKMTRDSIDTEKPDWLTQMETVLQALNEGVLIADDRHRVLFANSRFLEMTGIALQDLKGSGPSHFYSAQEWDFLRQQANAAFRTGHNRYAFVLPRKDGGRLPVIISSRTLQNSGSEFEIVTFTDISEQVRVEEELRWANARLQERQMEIEEDLRLAARVQKSLAPKSLVWDKISVDAFYHPVHSIGGDFALVNSLDQQHFSMLVCDVSGHGIGSALVANRIYSETTAHLRSGMPFLDMFGELNRFLIEDIAGSGMFVTMAAARIDAHDHIVLYTDGISEVFNSQGQMLGISGVQEIVRQSTFLRADEMKQGILDGVAAWRDGAPTDDVSLMLVMFAETDPNSMTEGTRHIEARFVFVAVAVFLAGLLIYTGNAAADSRTW